MTTTLERPADSAGELYRRTDISPEDFFQLLGRVRRAARDEIERLIQWLDSTIDCDQDASVDDDPCDGDPDVEPSLGSFDSMSNQIKAWQTTGFENADVDAELDICDREPSSAAPNPATWASQEDWAEGNHDDCEGDGCADDREGDELVHGGEAVHENDEPSLGWTDEEAATGRTYAGTMGRSADLEDGHGARPPQNRTEIDRPPVTVECSYRRFLHGLPADQKAALQDRMRSDSKVSLR
jgi:hypothetical protein